MNIKGFFSYKKPDVLENGYEFLEGDKESSKWDKKMNDQSSKSASQKDRGDSRDDLGNEDKNQSQTEKDGQKNQKDSEKGSGVSKENKDKKASEGGNSASNDSSKTQSKQEDKEENDDSQGDKNKVKQKGNSKDQKDEQKKSGDENEKDKSGDDSIENDKAHNDGDDEKQSDKSNAKKDEKKGKGEDKEEDEGRGEKLSSERGPKIKKPISIDELTRTKQGSPKELPEMPVVIEAVPKNTEPKNKKEEESEGDCQEREENQKKKIEKQAENAPDLTTVSKSLKDNIAYLRQVFHSPKNQDIIFREFNIAQKIPACVVFIDGMVDKSVIIQFTMPELMYSDPEAIKEGECPLEHIEKNLLTINQIARMCTYKDIIPQILAGLTIILVEGCDEVIVMESRGYEKRGISAPMTESVVHGSQEGFTENLRTNITLVRRIVKNENLVTEFHDISKTNNALCAILYLEGITNPRLVNEVRKRVTQIDVDFLLGNGMLEQLIEDKPGMLFPQTVTTERPDRVASFLMDGKVVVICEGTPFALAMPMTFYDLFQTSEDANVRWQYGTFLRIIRLLGILISALLPGLYVAVTLYHQEMIPTALLSSIVAARKSVPFPTIIEILLMEISFELIREGGIRVPGVIGQTLGIIGALILGQAAVSAGLVSPVLIIIVAVTGLGSFTIPNYPLSLAIRIVRFIFIAFGALAGFYGVSVGVTVVCSLALGMKSFGVPFFTPIAPMTNSNKDAIIRGPLYSQKLRVDYLNTQNQKRMGDQPRPWTEKTKKGGEGK